jgi:hypothetical protein
MTTKGTDNHGPYLMSMPANPFNGSSAVRFENGPSTAGSGKAGWVINIATGNIKPDDSAVHAAL